jgi:hypothetical protein
MTDNLQSRLADLAHEVRPIDLRDRVLAGSRRVGIRNAVLGSVATVVVLALLGVGAATALSRPHTTNVPIGPPGPSGSGALTVPQTEWHGVHDLDGKTVQIPAVPGNPGCSGPATLEYGNFASPGQASWYLYLFKVVRVDVDHDGTPDLVGLFRCGGEVSEWNQVVVYTGADNHLLGTVVQAPQRVTSDETTLPREPDIEEVSDIAAGPDGTIAVTVSDVADRYDYRTGWLGLHQTRTYRWDGRHFVQSAGPTRFDPNPGVDLALYPASTQYRTDDGKGSYLDLVVRNRGAVPVKDAQIELFLPPNLTTKPANGEQTGCTRTADRYVCRIGALPARGNPKVIEIGLDGELPVQGSADLQVRVVSVDPGAGTVSSDGHDWVRTELIRVK